MHAGYFILAMFVLFVVAMLVAIYYATKWELTNPEWDHSGWGDSQY